jgi:uncharacterized protein YeaO (DUF488 family)
MTERIAADRIRTKRSDEEPDDGHGSRIAERHVRLKRANDPPAGDDSVRVFVDKLWPRGVTKEGAAVDHWMKGIAPSTDLRKWFGHEPARWHEFRDRYAEELRQNADLLSQLRNLARQGRVTLVYSADDELHNGAIVLRDVLLGRSTEQKGGALTRNPEQRRGVACVGKTLASQLSEKALIPDERHGVPDPLQLRQKALSRWDNEGGATRQGPQKDASGGRSEPTDVPELTNAELVQLRVRVIALENLVIALLAEADDRQIALAREMAAYVSPRPGFTQHPLTFHAASHMVDLVERAAQFRPASGDSRAPAHEAQTDG